MIGITSSDKWITKQVILALMDPTPEALKPLIQQDRALEIARQVDPALDWAAFLYENGVDVSFRGVHVTSPVWIIESKRSGSGPVLFLDAKTRREITRVNIAPPPGTMPEQATPEAVVRRFFDLTSKGQYEAAWPLLHPVPVGLALSQLYALEGTAGPKLKAILETQLPSDDIGYKQAMCMCFLNPAKVTVELEDGTTQGVKVAKDQKGNWGILWQIRDGLSVN